MRCVQRALLLVFAMAGGLLLMAWCLASLRVHPTKLQYELQDVLPTTKPASSQPP